MNENLCLPALPGEMRDALYVRVRHKKNCASIMALAAWIVSKGLHLRSRKGFQLVRGSDRDVPDGMKERADMQSLGLTADKLRGAIKALVEVCFIDKEAGQILGWRRNFRGQARNPPCTYRVTEEFVSIWRKAKKEILSRISEAAVAAKTVAAKALASVSPTCLLENPSSAFSSPPERRIQNLAPCSGDLANQLVEKGLPVAQEAPGPAERPDVHDTRTDAEKAAFEAQWTKWEAMGLTRPKDIGGQ